MGEEGRYRRWFEDPAFVILLIFAVIPAIQLVLPGSFHIAEQLRPIFIFAFLGLGLNILTGFTGLLNLGAAGFMAIGVYTYSIFTSDIYPFQVGFWWGLLLAVLTGAAVGTVLGLPTLRLRGDYLAVVTLGFGEIIQDTLKNLEAITKGTQGINPVAAPRLFGIDFDAKASVAWYYLLWALLVAGVILVKNIERSRTGRSWISIREDELASTCMGINPVRVKLQSFALCAAMCSLAGGLQASYLGSSGEPSNYDFQISILALCIVIVGGMGSVAGVLIGSLVMVGFNSVFLAKLTDVLMRNGWADGSNVFSAPSNWKYFVFGLALVVMMRVRPEGLLPSRRVRREFSHAKAS